MQTLEQQLAMYGTTTADIDQFCENFRTEEMAATSLLSDVQEMVIRNKNGDFDEQILQILYVAKYIINKKFL